MTTLTNNADKARETAISKAMNAVGSAIKSSKEHAKLLKSATALSVLVLVEYGATEALNKLFKEVSNHDAEGVRTFIRAIHQKYGWKTDRGLEAGPVAFTKDRGWFVRNNDPANPAIAEAKAAIIKAGEAGLVKLSMGSNDRVNRAARDYEPEAALAAFIKRSAKEGASVAWLKRINALNDDAHRIPDSEIATLAHATETALEKAKARVAKLETTVKQREEKDKEAAPAEKQAAQA